MQMLISVANFTLNLRFDCEDCPGGTLLRLPDGVEATFNSPDCLVHLLEGMVGRRTWQTYRDQIEEQIAPMLQCA